MRDEPGVFRRIGRQWDTNLFAQGSIRQYFGAVDLAVNAKLDYNYMHYLTNPEGNDPEMYCNNVFRQREAYLSAAGEAAVTGWWRASLSADVQFNALDGNLVNFEYPRRGTVLAAAATALEFERFRFQASLLYTHVHDRTRSGGGAAGDRNRWTPTAVASWKPLRRGDLTLRAFYKRVFRMPTFNDLYYTNIGTKYLDPEYTTQYNLGAFWTRGFPHGWLRRIEVQVDGYLNRVKDKIVAYPSGGQGDLYRWTMINMGLVDIAGVDAAVQAALKAGKVDFNARVGYTWQRARDVTDKADEYYGHLIPYAPVHSGSAVVGATWRRWDLNYSFIYTGERWDARANIPQNYIEPWYTSDVAISRTIALRGSEMRLGAEVNNIFDQQYDVVLNYPMPGTNFMFKITWTL